MGWLRQDDRICIYIVLAWRVANLAAKLPPPPELGGGEWLGTERGLSVVALEVGDRDGSAPGM